MHTLKNTAARILGGTAAVIAIKEHVDAWNKGFDADLFLEEPGLTGVDHLDEWMAADAEYEAFAIGNPCPEWTNAPARFLNEPHFEGGKNSRILALSETPFSFRRRLLFSGLTTLAIPREAEGGKQ